MNTSTPSKTQTKSSDVKLGTFAGVFTPSFLTILGIILFLRLGYVVGQAGLGRALIILMLANGISVLTTFSLSAIATNLKVKGGGVYYLISRTLGQQFGGSIGSVLYLAQSVSIAFYCIGFAEVVVGLFGSDSHILQQLVAGTAVALIFVLAWLGADWATRFQYGVMTILGMALLSFFMGAFSQWNTALLSTNWTAPAQGREFWVLFAIFFPAVTGFTQGASMSGDLKDPGRSLSLGTFMAVGISILVYFLAAVFLAAALPRQVLMTDYNAMGQASAFSFLIVAGVIAATLSSAMASFLGAPRILQSLAADRSFPFLRPFAKGYGPTGNPRRGVILSAIIAYATIALGNLNLIAPVVSMFFLISYGLLNYATYYEAASGSPSFRPRFRWYSARASLAGAMACMGVMLAIDLVAGLAAMAVMYAIFQYLKRTAGPARWADSRRSYHLQRIREHLFAAAGQPEHSRNWRPQILLLSDDSHRRKYLLQFASWIQGRSGITTAVRIVGGEGLKAIKNRDVATEELQNDIQAIGLQAFALAMAAPDRYLALQALVQSYGIGPLHANTVLLNWMEDHSADQARYWETLYGRSLRTAYRLGCNLVVLNADADHWGRIEDLPGNERRIDIWWWGDATSRLMLLLAHLLRRSDQWQGSQIHILAVETHVNVPQATEDLKQLLEDVRIEAEPEIVAAADLDKIATLSHDAAIVFLPFRLRGSQPLGPFGQPLDTLLKRLPSTVLVLAAEDVDLDAEPEEGEAGEKAAAADTLEDARRRLGSAEKELESIIQEIDVARHKLQEITAAESQDTDTQKMEELNKEIHAAEERLTAAKRKLGREKAKVESAARAAEALGVETKEKEASDAGTGETKKKNP